MIGVKSVTVNLAGRALTRYTDTLLGITKFPRVLMAELRRGDEHRLYSALRHKRFKCDT